MVILATMVALLVVLSRNVLYCRLVASVAMVCAVSLSSAALPSSTGPNQGGKVETWSPTEAAYTFEVVLWALSTQYAPSHNCASHSMSESFEQMQLAGGKHSLAVLLCARLTRHCFDRQLCRQLQTDLSKVCLFCTQSV